MDTPFSTLTTPTVVDDVPFEEHVAIHVDCLESDASTALAPGPVIETMSKPAFALYLQSGLVVLMQNLLPPLKTYVFANYLHGSSAHIAQLTALENLAWTLRVFFAILSDAVPVFGYKRKFWMGVGWLVTLASLCVMAFSDFGAPYCDPNDYPGCWHPNANITSGAFDLAAPSRVSWYRIPTFFATLGVVIVAASADGLLVEYSQREPIVTRGQIMVMTYATTGSGGLNARFFNQFFLNGERYGGTYSFSAGPNVAYYFAISMALLGLGLVVGMFHDTKPALVKQESSSSSQRWSSGLWKLLHNRGIAQLLAFRFAFNLFSMISGAPILSWVTNLDMGWINITPRLLFISATMYYGRFALQWNWRRVLAFWTFSNIVLMALATFFVICDVSRNAYLYSVLLVLTGVPVAIINLIMAVIAGLWASIRDLNVPIANKVRSWLLDGFPATMSLKDDAETKHHVAYMHLIAFAIQLIGLVWIVLLPSQKIPLAMMKQRGGATSVGVLVALGYVALMAFSWQQNVHSYAQ
ncbi:hypothetical protein SPRG_21056 [Saprolegnia parasitica CBS 223.65]|uniref:Transmembrane protein n=1 Tax=Saprolegnia parasitica (strain CBS 223.65) TaxID=695850 RepID=A0A067BXF1_SAPPC|nr:hypothetical protein SPRG_21056 [Saprolegnia parasitica CBS 223.65]KDO22968.1 hypothetical protein SPRG_21056 [Saprolegnia parasitica CBS 223.65]|eukprot:XP_012206332.1 hypothetical protein SPRG_21056 [Saprolegnia parasitica CBS 223.65]